MPSEIATPFLIAVIVFGIALVMPALRRRHPARTSHDPLTTARSRLDELFAAAREGLARLAATPRPWFATLARAARDRSDRVGASARSVGIVALLCLVVGVVVAAWPMDRSVPQSRAVAATSSAPTLTPIAPSVDDVAVLPEGSPAPDGEATDGVRLGRSRLSRDRDARPADDLIDVDDDASSTGGTGGGSGGGGGGGSGGGGGGGGSGGGGGGGGSGGGGGGDPSLSPSPDPSPDPTVEPSPDPSPEPTTEPSPETTPCEPVGNGNGPCRPPRI